MAQESYHFRYPCSPRYQGTYNIKDKKQQKPTPKSIYTYSTKHTLPYERAYLCRVNTRYGQTSICHLPLNSIIRKSLIFEKVRRKRYERLSLKIGQTLDSRQQLIASNPQNDNCKSNEKYSVKQKFEGELLFLKQNPCI